MTTTTSLAIAALARFGTATLHEAMGKRGALDPAIRPLWPGARLCGPARPVVCQPGDNLMVHWALATARPGEVLVVGTGGFPEAGYWGFITTVAARAAGVAGLVIDGCVRDADQIAGDGFPVFCRGTSIRGTTKVGHGLANGPLTIAGQTIAPGDVIVGDTDGVVVVPGGEAVRVAQAAAARDAHEAELIAALRGGACTVDLLGLRPTLAALGLLETGS